MDFLKIFNGVGIFTVFLVLFISFFYPIPLDLLNSDLGRHLLLGEIIVSSKSVPTVNLLSYTNPDYPFINTHWFSEVIFYQWHNVFGFNGLIILSLLLATATLTLVFIYSARKFDIFTTILISLIFLQAISGRTQVRPELFSFLFLSIFLVVLYRYRERYTKWIFVLIPIALLWVNTHIYFFNGIVVLVIFLIDALLSEQRNFKSKKFLTLVSVTISVGLVTLLNPHFIKGAFYPFFVLNEYAVPVRENIHFFHALNMTIKPSTIFFQISVGILWISMILARKKMSRADFLIAGFFTFMGFFAVRNFPLFVFGTFIPCVKATSYIVGIVLERYKEKKQVILLGIFILVCIAIIPSLRWNIQNHQIGFGVTDNINGAIDFFEKNQLSGPIYNNYDIGNYLEYRLYPTEKVYVDNRPEAYPKEFFENTYFPMQKSQEIFEIEDRKYNFNVIILAHTDPSSGTNQLLYRLVRDENWKIIYLNSIAIILIKNSPENQNIIQKYAFDQNSLRIHEDDMDTKDKVSQLVHFLKVVDWPQHYLEMNIRYLDFEPNNCAALQNIIYTSQTQNIKIIPLYRQRFIQNCI